MAKPNEDKDPELGPNEDADAILSTGEADINEELYNLGGYREFVREHNRLSEE